jgi:hypothetical protein
MSEHFQSDAYVVEVGGQTVGIVARDGTGFTFHASVHSFNALEGRLFATPRQAEKAALELTRRAMRRRNAGARFRSFVAA